MRLSIRLCLIISIINGAAFATQVHADNASGYRLDRLWPTSAENSGIVAYQQNYLLFTHTDTPNFTPTSPNPQNQVTPSYVYDTQEIKFQFSLKSQYPLPSWMGESNSMWFGYTQQSNWQYANIANSRPFRENNYELEPFIFSHQFNKLSTVNKWSLRFINLGYMHESNGQALPYSRSWDRVYLQFGVEKRLSSNSSFAVVVRPWSRYPKEMPATDDNQDIEDYLGQGDLQLIYWGGKQMVSALIRRRSLQLDWSVPMSNGERTNKSLHLHLQFFTGYGESLIDYNQKHSVAGIGVSLPYDLPANGR